MRTAAKGIRDGGIGGAGRLRPWRSLHSPARAAVRSGRLEHVDDLKPRRAAQGLADERELFVEWPVLYARPLCMPVLRRYSKNHLII